MKFSKENKRKKGLVMPLVVIIVVFSIGITMLLDPVLNIILKSHGGQKTFTNNLGEVDVVSPLNKINNHLYVFLKSNKCSKELELTNNELIERYLNLYITDKNFRESKDPPYTKSFTVENKGKKTDIIIESCVYPYINLLRSSGQYRDVGIFVEIDGKKIKLTSEDLDIPKIADFQKSRLILAGGKIANIYMYVS